VCRLETGWIGLGRKTDLELRKGDTANGLWDDW
jgi:hypothetical protein